jgi:hypothetical protein
MNLKKNFLTYTLIFFIVLLFTRIDFRTSAPTIYSIGDDSNYYFHNQTLAFDLDLDYSNQTVTTGSDKYYNQRTDTFIPIHPIGSTIFSIPFMLIGKIVEEVFNLKNFHYFLYSLSSIFYLFISLRLLLSSVPNFVQLNRLSKLIFIILFLNGGLLYFSFERFGMTHVYEVLCVSLLFKLASNIVKNIYPNLNLFFLGYLSYALFLVRFSNYFIFLTPFFYFIITKKKYLIKKLIINKFFISGSFLGIISLFTFLNLLFGKIILNPSILYTPDNSKVNKFLENEIYSRDLLEFLLFAANSIGSILFSFEFGLFFTLPVIFVSLLMFIKFVLNKNFLELILSLLVFSIPFGLVVFWQTTASSFGYRYLYVLIPYAFLIIVNNDYPKLLNIYFLIFGVFSILIYLFFETNSLTILSENINSFGRLHKYSAPLIVKGTVEAIFQFKSYLVIIFTSYLGVFLIKIFISIFDVSLLQSFLSENNYLNSDTIELIDYSNSINWVYFLFIFVLSVFISTTLIKYISKDRLQSH